jgi:Zn-dependent membrane protease YugP
MSIWGLYIDPLYLFIFILTIIISLVTQLYIRNAYKKWSTVRNSENLNGAQVGNRIINRSSLYNFNRDPGVQVDSIELRKLRGLVDKDILSEGEYQAKAEQLKQDGRASAPGGIQFKSTKGVLTDNYDPRTKTVNLSEKVAKEPSVASMAIVAHELGHAQQDQDQSMLLKMRNFLVPAVTISPRIAYLLIFIGLIFYLPSLFWLGVMFYGLMVIFSIITVPVEVNASRRAIRLLGEAGMLQSQTDEQGTKQVLRAAASTYIASAITSILYLFYYLSLARRRR